MIKKMQVWFFSLFIVMLLAGSSAFAQSKDRIEGFWMNHEQTAKIKIFKAANGKFYGNIVWLKEPNKNGHPKIDHNNPDASKRNQPLVNLQVLKGFSKTEENIYEDGTIYNPKNGKTYSSKITCKGNTIDIRGYIGISLIGRSTVWERAE